MNIRTRERSTEIRTSIQST